jgi:hypothetical protein
MLEADHQFRHVNGYLHLPKTPRRPRRLFQQYQGRKPE